MLFKVILPLLLCSAFLFFCLPARANAIDDWNAIIIQANNQKLEGRYDLAAESFNKAISLTEKQKLPDKYLPISLCRLAAVEVITNKVKEAEPSFEQAVSLIKKQKDNKTLDPQVNFWAAALADEYLSNHKPETRELCLKRACYLKNLVYGAGNKECTDCLSKLADCYIDEGQTDKAINTLTIAQALIAKTFGPAPDVLADKLNALAIKCKNEHKYNQAEQLELAVIKLAKQKTASQSLKIGLPAFNCLLGANALAQGKKEASKSYYQCAIKEGRLLRNNKNKQFITKYLDLLPAAFWLDRLKSNYQLAETEYNELILLHKTIATNLDTRYDALTKLADVYAAQNSEHKNPKNADEAIKCLKENISIAESKNSNFKQTLPDLYVRLGSIQGGLSNEGRKSFLKALELENDKSGYHTALVYFYWGWHQKDVANDLAANNFDISYRLVKALPPEKRGTLYADLLQLLANTGAAHGHSKEAEQLYKESKSEIQLQKKLHNQLGPDLFHRM